MPSQNFAIAREKKIIWGQFEMPGFILNDKKSGLNTPFFEA